MEKIIYNNTFLGQIINAITNGTVGLGDADIESYVITNDNMEIFRGLVIKPTLIDIKESCLSYIGDAGLKVDSVDNELMEYICYTASVDEDGNKTLYTQSLTETIVMWQSQNVDLLQSPGWKLTQIVDENSHSTT